MKLGTIDTVYNTNTAQLWEPGSCSTSRHVDENEDFISSQSSQDSGIADVKGNLENVDVSQYGMESKSKHDKEHYR